MVIGSLLVLLLGRCTYWDIKKKEIPCNLLVIGGAIIVPLQFVLGRGNFIDTCFGILIGVMLMGLSKLTRGAIGMGDALVMVLLGTVVGGWNALLILFYSVMLSAVVSMGLLAFHKVHRKDTLPFLPYLFLSYMGVWLL